MGFGALDGVTPPTTGLGKLFLRSIAGHVNEKYIPTRGLGAFTAGPAPEAGNGVPHRGRGSHGTRLRAGMAAIFRRDG